MTTAASPHLLIVDDHKDIRDLLGKYLSQQGYRVSLAKNGQELRQALKGQSIDLIVLDIMMPGEDGLTLCRDIRAHDSVPIIFLTAMGEETDRIIGLEMGADDYLSKPFNPRELLARIKAVLRRAESLPPQRGELPESQGGRQLAFDRWILQVDQRQLLNEKEVVVALSTAEYQLLTAFLQHPNRVLSRDQLMDLTRGRASEAFDRSIDNQVSRLRKKIERDPKAPELIKTVWGGGYRFGAEVSEL
ncbi:response regulator [Rhodovibrionaceae bacterium A322]